MLFGSELTILFIPWRQIYFTSVALCAQISCFLDFTLLIPNKRFLLSFLLQLNLYCSLHYFAQDIPPSHPPPQFHISEHTAQLVGLLIFFWIIKNQTQNVNVLSILFSSKVYDHSTKSAIFAQFPRAWSVWKLSYDFCNTSSNS